MVVYVVQGLILGHGVPNFSAICDCSNKWKEFLKKSDKFKFSSKARKRPSLIIDRSVSKMLGDCVKALAARSKFLYVRFFIGSGQVRPQGK